MPNFILLAAVFLLAAATPAHAQNNDTVNRLKTEPVRKTVEVRTNNSGTSVQQRIQIEDRRPGENLTQEVMMEKRSDIVVEKNTGNQRQPTTGAQDVPGSRRMLLPNETASAAAGPKLEQQFERRQEQLTERLQKLETIRDRQLQSRSAQVASRAAAIQERVEKATTKIEQRSRWLSMLWGQDQEAVDELRSQAQALQEEELELTQLLEEADSSADQAAIEEALTALQLERQALSEQIQETREQVSLFGWSKRLLGRWF